MYVCSKKIYIMEKGYKGRVPVEGEVFGHLALTGKSWFVQEKQGRRLFVEAMCKCGVVRGYSYRFLFNNNTKSCGCVREEKFKEANTTHNLSHHPIYPVYMDMLNRCYSPTNGGYENYGGRGISVCQEWRDDIHAFRLWAMLNGYAKGLQIDRINNDGNYEPGNCQFITKDENNKKTRRSVFLKAFGEEKNQSDWILDERCIVTGSTFISRIKKGWDVATAMITPSHDRTSEIIRKTQGKQIYAFGETKTTMDWVEDSRCVIGYSGLKIRLSKGWDAEKAISTPALRKDKNK